MFLPQDAIEAMLEKCGISGWDHFYLSCEVGLRKDSGKLYQHVLNHENVSPSEIVMFGDNERSDFQIPADLGLQAIHVMKPSNLLKAIPRFADLIPDARSASPGEQFVFGAIAAENFSSVSFPQFSADDMFRSAQQIGYGLLGPIVLSFCQWLERKVAEDGLKCLHFLAREGKFLKRAFDLWQRTRPHPTKTEYLLISRRAITVPCISEISDALDIASANDFYGASIESFLVERFGITLDDATWIEIERRKLWQRDQPLEIRNGSVEHLKPLIARIMPEIISEAQAERESALTYFKRMKLDNKESAVVDVGYGGTIQRHLIKLLGTEISGLYLVTDERGHDWGVQSGVSVNGCFVEGASRTPQASPMFLHSFLIEKMLSASDRQVMRYTGDGEIEFRDFQENEDKGADTRTEMQDAAIKFITEAATIRDDLLGEFTVSSKLCETLFARFSTHLSPNERRVFENLALDDFYCGRGIVN
ncbi:hypothetical protein L284_12850 [Novosphingobium lindaniclasticum LE124]|uniref:HAD family hydrolase n=2 Tax=Novosphingobium TaxID=165696 RepID=T0IY00_9SPHN|nr:hypothetical protein L284_12850 [Novosphingobium lindaniclasticum LE124]